MTGSNAKAKGGTGKAPLLPGNKCYSAVHIQVFKVSEVLKLLEQQSAWQKRRKDLSWPEKIRMAEVIRDSSRLRFFLRRQEECGVRSTVDLTDTDDLVFVVDGVGAQECPTVFGLMKSVRSCMAPSI